MDSIYSSEQRTKLQKYWRFYGYVVFLFCFMFPVFDLFLTKLLVVTCISNEICFAKLSTYSAGVFFIDSKQSPSNSSKTTMCFLVKLLDKSKHSAGVTALILLSFTFSSSFCEKNTHNFTNTSILL